VTYLTIVEIIVKSLVFAMRGRERGGCGFLGLVLTLVFAGIAKLLEEGYDLFRNFIIPAMINTERTFWESVEDLKHLKDRIPESIVGVLGFDLVSGAVTSILLFIGIILVVSLTILAFFITPLLAIPVAAVTVLVLVTALAVASQLLQFAKSTYFTLLWIELNEPDVLKKNPDLSAYLEHAKERVSTARSK